MNSVLKNRLVGALVVLLSMIIFLPLWLDGENVNALVDEDMHPNILNGQLIPADPYAVKKTTSVANTNAETPRTQTIDLNEIDVIFNNNAHDAKAAPASKKTVQKSTQSPKKPAPKDKNAKNNATKQAQAKQNASKPKSTAKSQSTHSQAVISQSTAPKAPKPAILTKSHNWTVQAASFYQQSQAETLVKRFVNKGYSSYLKISQLPNGKQAYRVYVGPFTTSDEAKKAQSGLALSFKIKDSILKKYRK